MSAWGRRPKRLGSSLFRLSMVRLYSEGNTVSAQKHKISFQSHQDGMRMIDTSIRSGARVGNCLKSDDRVDWRWDTGDNLATTVPVMSLVKLRSRNRRHSLAGLQIFLHSSTSTETLFHKDYQYGYMMYIGIASMQSRGSLAKCQGSRSKYHVVQYAH
jgi:hypothetical protein